MRTPAIKTPSNEYRLVALDPNGAKRWEFPQTGSLSSATTSPVVGSDGTVFVACSGGLYAVSPSGVQKWLLPGQFAGGPPAIGGDGTLYVVDGNRNLLAVDPANGSRKWARPTTWGIFLAAVAPDGSIYTLTPERRLCAFNPDGTQKWVSDVAGLSGAMIAFAADGTAYAAGSKLYAVNPDGTLKWQFSGSAQESFNGFPVVGADGTIYAAGLAQAAIPPFTPTIHLYALNADGSRKWALANTGNAAIASDGTVYAAGTELFALGPDGAQKWRFQGADTGDGWSPVIGQDGTVYLWSSAFTKLFAVHGSAGPADSPWPMFGHDARHTSRAGAGR